MINNAYISILHTFFLMGQRDHCLRILNISNLIFKLTLSAILLILFVSVCMPASAEVFGRDYFDSPTPGPSSADSVPASCLVTINPGDSLQDAIDKAGNGGTVILNPGLYRVAGVECSGNIRLISNSSAGGDRSNTIVTSIAENKSLIYGFWIGEIVVEGITLSGTSGGGALVNFGGKAVLISSAITDCTTNGLGCGISAGKAIVSDSIITNCHSAEGGGIFAYGDIIIENSTITNCSGGCGGAACGLSPRASIRVTNSIISDCYAEFYGGGIYCNYNESSITAANTTFTDCLAGHNGGAVCGGDRSIVTVDGCIISNCSTSDNVHINNKYGGAVCGGEDSVITIANCSVTGSYADDDGGAVYGWKDSQILITGSSFENCYASGKGGFLGMSPGSYAKIGFSRIYNCDSNHKTSIYAGGSSKVDAENNWWGSNGNPSEKIYGAIDADPWLIFSSEVLPDEIEMGEETKFVAGLYSNSDGEFFPDPVCLPDGIKMAFLIEKDGVNLTSQNSGMVSGISEMIFSPKSPGCYEIYSSLDDQTLKSELNVSGDDLSTAGALGLVIFLLIMILMYVVLYSGKEKDDNE